MKKTYNNGHNYREEKYNNFFKDAIKKSKKKTFCIYHNHNTKFKKNQDFESSDLYFWLMTL